MRLSYSNNQTNSNLHSFTYIFPQSKVSCSRLVKINITTATINPQKVPHAKTAIQLERGLAPIDFHSRRHSGAFHSQKRISGRWFYELLCVFHQSFLLPTLHLWTFTQTFLFFLSPRYPKINSIFKWPFKNERRTTHRHISEFYLFFSSISCHVDCSSFAVELRMSLSASLSTRF